MFLTLAKIITTNVASIIAPWQKRLIVLKASYLISPHFKYPESLYVRLSQRHSQRMCLTAMYVEKFFVTYRQLIMSF